MLYSPLLIQSKSADGMLNRYFEPRKVEARIHSKKMGNKRKA
jgi:hypothetical protein